MRLRIAQSIFTLRRFKTIALFARRRHAARPGPQQQVCAVEALEEAGGLRRVEEHARALQHQRQQLRRIIAVAEFLAVRDHAHVDGGGDFGRQVRADAVRALDARAPLSACGT